MDLTIANIKIRGSFDGADNEPMVNSFYKPYNRTF